VCFVLSVLMCDVCIFLLCLLVVSLPPGKTPFAVQLNNNHLPLHCATTTALQMVAPFPEIMDHCPPRPLHLVTAVVKPLNSLINYVSDGLCSSSGTHGNVSDELSLVTRCQLRAACAAALSQYNRGALCCNSSLRK
jgi:hypothetical protein